MGEEGHDRIETTVIELAKTDTFFSLLGAKNLDLELYLNVLHDAVQVNLIGLLYTEEIAKHYPLSDDMKQKAADYMQKLVELGAGFTLARLTYNGNCLSFFQIKGNTTHGFYFACIGMVGHF